MTILFFVLLAVLTAADALTKNIAVRNISEGEVIKAVTAGETDILSFSMHHNTGAAFSSFLGKTSVLAVFTVIAMIAMTVFFLREKHKHPLMTVSFAMIVGGGIGNLIDRVRLSYVVDFINLWPFTFIFNFADVCVVIGAILLGVYYIFIDEKYKQRFETTVENEKDVEENEQQ